MKKELDSRLMKATQTSIKKYVKKLPIYSKIDGEAMFKVLERYCDDSG